MLHARAGSPVPHTEAVPPACSAFHFPCKHEESSPLAVLSLSLSPARRVTALRGGHDWTRCPVPGGAKRAVGSDGPCPRGLCSSSSGQAAPRRGAGKGTEPSVTVSPAPGQRLPAGTPALPSRFSPWLLLPVHPLQEKNGGKHLPAHPSPGENVPWPPRDGSTLQPRTKRLPGRLPLRLPHPFVIQHLPRHSPRAFREDSPCLGKPARTEPCSAPRLPTLRSPRPRGCGYLRPLCATSLLGVLLPEHAGCCTMQQILSYGERRCARQR